MASGPDTPPDVKRRLRREAGFGCCRCGHPFVEYHHIVPTAQEHHNRPEDMMAVCPNDHRAITNGGIPAAMQREWKAKPHNISRRLVHGQLLAATQVLAVELGRNLFAGPGPKLVMDGVPLLSISTNRDRSISLSVDLRDDSDQSILTIVENEWITGDASAWDIEFHHNVLVVRSAPRKISLEVDARGDVVAVSGVLFKNGRQFTLCPSALLIDEQVTGTHISGVGLVCMALAADSSARTFSFLADARYGEGVICNGGSKEQTLALCETKYGEILHKLNLGRNDPCVCGSGRKWKFCCSLAG